MKYVKSQPDQEKTHKFIESQTCFLQSPTYNVHYESIMKVEHSEDFSQQKITAGLKK